MGPRCAPSSTPTLSSVTPGYSLDFLCEVLRNDATFLLFLFVFAWKEEKCGVSASMFLGHPLGLRLGFKSWTWTCFAVWLRSTLETPVLLSLKDLVCHTDPLKSTSKAGYEGEIRKLMERRR